jgi:hypothetical protein
MDDRTRLLLLSGAVPAALFAVISLRSLVKANWLAPAYFTLIILGVHRVLSLDDGLRRLVRGLASSVVLLLVAGAALITPDLPLMYRMNTWSGWKEAAARVERISEAERAAGRESFVFSPGYKASAMMWFYLPGQPRTYAQDIYGERALQFDLFPLERDLTGATGLLVLSAQDEGRLDRERLMAFFDACDPVDTVDAAAFGRVARHIQIQRCTNYKGHPRRTRHDAHPGSG